MSQPEHAEALMGRRHMDAESDMGSTPSSHHHHAPHIPWRHVGPAPRAGAVGRLVHRKPYGGPCEHQPFQKLLATPTRVRSTRCCCDIQLDELAEMVNTCKTGATPDHPAVHEGRWGHPSDTAGRWGVVETVKPDGHHQAAGEAWNECPARANRVTETRTSTLAAHV